MATNLARYFGTLVFGLFGVGLAYLSYHEFQNIRDWKADAIAVEARILAINPPSWGAGPGDVVIRTTENQGAGATMVAEFDLNDVRHLVVDNSDLYELLWDRDDKIEVFYRGSEDAKVNTWFSLWGPVWAMAVLSFMMSSGACLVFFLVRDFG